MFCSRTPSSSVIETNELQTIQQLNKQVCDTQRQAQVSCVPTTQVQQVYYPVYQTSQPQVVYDLSSYYYPYQQHVDTSQAPQVQQVQTPQDVASSALPLQYPQIYTPPYWVPLQTLYYGQLQTPQTPQQYYDVYPQVQQAQQAQQAHQAQQVQAKEYSEASQLPQGFLDLPKLQQMLQTTLYEVLVQVMKQTDPQLIYHVLPQVYNQVVQEVLTQTLPHMVSQSYKTEHLM